MIKCISLELCMNEPYDAFVRYCKEKVSFYSLFSHTLYKKNKYNEIHEAVYTVLYVYSNYFKVYLLTNFI